MIVCSAASRSCCAVRIVDIHDAIERAARAGAFKQAALGGEIILHGVVKIEMIAGQIGEDGHGEAAAPQAIERQRVRAAFQHRVRPAFPHDFGEEALQVQRFRRGGFGRIGFQRSAIFDGAE